MKRKGLIENDGQRNVGRIVFERIQTEPERVEVRIAENLRDAG